MRIRDLSLALLVAGACAACGKESTPSTKPAAVSAGAGQTSSAWTITDARLATDPLEGRVRVTVNGKEFQSPLEPSGHGG